jgi:hypothetical protein
MLKDVLKNANLCACIINGLLRIGRQPVSNAPGARRNGING